MNFDNNQEFQILKITLKENVKEYLELEEQIKVLSKAIKERKDKKKEISNDILHCMKRFDISQMNTKDGKLIYNVRNNKVPLNKNNITKALSTYFNSENKAQEACKFILENREIKEKISLRRTKLKIPKTTE